MAAYRKGLDPGSTSPGDPVARELDEEIRAHLEMRTEELVARGMDPQEARAEALRRFDGAGGARRRLLAGARRAHRSRSLRDARDALAADVRLAWRRARRAPGFTLVALAIFAGGVGLTTSMVSVADHVLFRPLPFEEPDDLVALWSVTEQGSEFSRVSMGNWVDWKEGGTTLEGTALYGTHRASVATDVDAFYAPASRVAGPFFATLGTAFAVGRAFTEREAQDEAPVAVVSEGFWRGALGADPEPLARELVVNGRPVRVVGVVEAGRGFPGGTEVWLPLRYRAETGALRNNINYRALARLGDGVTIPRARAELDAVAAGIREADPVGVYSWGVGVRPLRGVVVGDARGSLILLTVAVGALLLVACANLAGLSLARARGRRRETAVHLALGSGRKRLVRRVVVEHLLLAGVGGGVGVVLAGLATGVLLDRVSSVVPRVQEVGFDLRVAGLGIVISLGAGLVAGLIPALRESRRDLSEALSGARGEITGGRGLPGAVMVGTEVALAVALVVAGGLLLRSFQTLVTRELGFETEEVVTADLALVGPEYQDAEARLLYWDALTGRVEALPGVARAAVSNAVPTGDGGRGWIDLAGRIGEDIGTDYRVVSEGYFQALGIPLHQGRFFGPSDGPGTERVAVVSRSVAERFWPDGDVLGQRIRARSMERYIFGPDEAPWLTVVGVVGNVRQYGFESGWQDDLYVLHRQVPYYTRGMTLVARGRGAGGELAPAVRAAVREVDPAVAVAVSSMEARLAGLTRERRLVLSGMGLFGGASLLLVCLGIYGLMSFAARARTRELAIRAALGAGRGGIVRLMLVGALRVVIGGAVVGLVLAWALSRLLAGFLVEVGATDPVTYVGAVALLTAVALTAALVPSLRAARRDPLESLGAEG